MNVHSSAMSMLLHVIDERLGLKHRQIWDAPLQRLLDPVSQPETASPLLPADISRLCELPIESKQWQSVINAITNGETRFNRDPEWFDEIVTEALHPMIDSARLEGTKRLRLWSAGCSSGEEAYSLAMLLCDAIPDIERWSIDIVATDIRVDALKEGEEGLYSKRQLRQMEARSIDRYFRQVDGKTFSVGPDLRKLVTFHFANIVDAPELLARRVGSGFDLIVCRNVIMYLNNHMQQRVADTLSGALAVGGWLAVSPAEASAQWFSTLDCVATGPAILFTRKRLNAVSSGHFAEADFPVFQSIMPDGERQPAIDWPPLTAIPADPTPVEEPESAPAPEASATMGEDLSSIRSLADGGFRVEALDLCQNYIRKFGSEASSYLLLAEICIELGDMKQAKDAARRAIYLEPENAAAHYFMASAQWRDGQIGKARTAMRSALSLVDETADNDSQHLSGDHIRRAATAFLTGDSPTIPEAANVDR